MMLLVNYPIVIVVCAGMGVCVGVGIAFAVGLFDSDKSNSKF